MTISSFQLAFQASDSQSRTQLSKFSEGGGNSAFVLLQNLGQHSAGDVVWLADPEMKLQLSSEANWDEIYGNADTDKCISSKCENRY